MAISFEVPQWLQPPSPAEQQRIDMAKQAAQERAAMMMQRYIGSQRAQRDAQAAIANGVDPITARQNALLNNAHLLFADNPEAVSNMVNHQEANAIRDRAQLQLNQHREIQDLLKAKLNEQAQERLDETVKHNAETEDLKRQQLDNSALTADLRRQMDEKDLELKKQREQRLGKQAVASQNLRLDTILQTDKEYQDLQAALSKANNHLASVKARKGSKIPLYGTTKEDESAAQKAADDAQAALTNFRKSKAARYGLDEVPSEDEAPTPKAAPAAPAAEPKPTAKPSGLPKELKLGTIIKQNGKRYSYIGGDTNDPDSWAEVVE